MPEPLSILELDKPSSASISGISRLELQFQIEQFYYLEAALLDEWRFREWLDLLADDIRYVLPTASNAQTRDRKRCIAPPSSNIMDDQKQHLEVRVARLETGMAWAEEPPSRTKHLVTNVRVVAQPDAATIEVTSNFFICRCQKERDVIYYVGSRRDMLRYSPGTSAGWLVAKRDIIMDQATMHTHNITVFF